MGFRRGVGFPGREVRLRETKSATLMFSLRYLREHKNIQKQDKRNDNNMQDGFLSKFYS